ncbi:long-chain fatty alcohol dehydrogenase [Grosmannia clavigera kw1407]|uniref:Long-chain fatty alcohol dehydrogenase n=1 Tax=Grosmannia clavigera (strain kw1407 / UAMH 11150) TaxID=655863 RepID=F0XC64_GROCL|nr:long-chain fatty alcohol dehydrogenase [Grosmannia clavigera kw1407]EFX04185.1 long-chain fatty alcohol dehydrogenase [Grosmannia clavigera kw1407]
MARRKEAAEISPRPLSLAPAPSGDWWDESQWAVLLALLDAVLSPIVAADTASSTGLNRRNAKCLSRADFDATVAHVRAAVIDPPDAALVASYLADRPSDHPVFVQGIKRTLAGQSPASRKQLGDVLALLTGHAGSLLLTGYWTPVHQQPFEVREAILRGWKNAWSPPLRILGRTLCVLAQTTWLVSSPLFPQASSFRETPADWKPAQEHADFCFLQFDDASEPAVIETDVVIVGSGCGGSVCAEVLAATGHRVLVVEKGYHYPPSQLPMPQNVGLRLLYENGGQLASANPNVSVVAGSCWGGGGAINWSVCLRTPDVVRREWAAGQDGMSFLETPAFDACLDRVCDFMCVEKTAAAVDEHDRCHRGQVVLEGAAKLRFKASSLLQNTRDGLPHDDGYCHLGCASSEKRGTAVSWLPAAAAAGAQFIEGFDVDRVLFDDDDGTSTSIPLASAEPKATGIVGTWLSRDPSGSPTGPEDQRRRRRIVIKAKKVIVSSGTLNSPLLLLRSGLTNPQIGRNLHLHPCNMVGAFFDEETKPMDHGIITSICTSFDDMDGHGHGPRLEPTCMVPYAILTTLPWSSGLDFKLAALRYRHYDGFIALTRDRDSGRVFPDPVTGQPVVDYDPSSFDRENAVEGVIGLARLCHVQGANEIRAYLAGVEPYVRAKTGSSHDEDDALAFEAWINGVRAAGLSRSSLWGGWQAANSFLSAHQMGTCRMADDGGANSVVSLHGHVWGTRNLLVADASVFPSASGANPMVTVMALAQWIAQGLAKELAEGA